MPFSLAALEIFCFYLCRAKADPALCLSNSVDLCVDTLHLIWEVFDYCSVKYFFPLPFSLSPFSLGLRLHKLDA